MSRRAAVVGVGMIAFTTPRNSAPYDVMAESGARSRSATPASTTRGPAGLRRLRLRRLDRRAGRALRGGHDRHPDRQRQQQLLDRLVGAVPGAAGGRDRRRRLRAGAGLRADAARRARVDVERPAERRSPGSTTRTSGAAGRASDAPDGGAVLRRRGRGVLPRSTAWTPRCSRRSRSRRGRHAANNPYAVFRDPVTVEEVLASPRDLRPADPAAVLPADLRRGGRDRLQRGVRRRPRPRRRRGDQRRRR